MSVVVVRGLCELVRRREGYERASLYKRVSKEGNVHSDLLTILPPPQTPFPLSLSPIDTSEPIAVLLLRMSPRLSLSSFPLLSSIRFDLGLGLGFRILKDGGEGEGHRCGEV